MKVTISKESTCGKVEVPAGEYMVALASDTGQLVLVGGGKDYKIPAVRRRSSSKSRVTTVSLIPGGGTQFSLVMSTPKQGEWISMLEVKAGGKRETEKRDGKK
jgi:hypothetical protein